MSPSTDSDPKCTAADLAGNQDLIVAILLHLPLKSLLRFTSVSKPWLRLISSPYFSRSHARRNPNPPPSALCFYRTLPPVPGCLRFLNPFSDVLESASFSAAASASTASAVASASTASAVAFLNKIAGGKAKVLQSINGLILCSATYSSNCCTCYYVCNAFTKQLSVVPDPGVKPNKVIAGVNLAHDPLKFSGYRVICIWRSEINGLLEIEICSQSSAHWEPCGDPFEDSEPGSYFTHGVYWNGGIQWHNAGVTGLCFDIEMGCVKTMPLPPLKPNYFFHMRFVHFGACGGRLFMVEIDIDCKPWMYNVLEMKKDRSGWVSRYRIGLYACLASRFPKIVKGGCKIVSVVAVAGEEDNDIALVLSLPGKCVSYNLKDGSVNVLSKVPADRGENSVLQLWYDYLLYETLARV